MTAYKDNMEWSVENVVVESFLQDYPCCHNAFAHVKYTFTLARRSQFYTQFLILPCVLLGIVIPSIFWIPPSRPDRTGLGKCISESSCVISILLDGMQLLFSYVVMIGVTHSRHLTLPFGTIDHLECYLM